MKKPVSLEIAGQQHTFEYGKTIVHAYRYETDQPFNHIEAIEFDSQKIYIFNAIPHMMLLAGVELHGHEFDKKQVKQITNAMNNEFGWEATLCLNDEAPEEVKERYIKLATVALKNELYVPTEWSSAT